ncbi:hypothetical protein D9M70_626290 [compost metagenome]
MPRRVEFTRQPVGLDVEIVGILRLVDAHAPDDDRRVVPVALDHAADVLDRLLLPGPTADMLPAGDFLEDEQADAVAMVEKPLGLRIVRGADKVAM